MTTYTIYANANDHTVNSTDATYANARAGSGSKTDTSTATTVGVGQLYTGSYGVRQHFMSFDTSAVPTETPASIGILISFATNPTSQQYDIAESAWSGGTGDFVPGASLSGLPAFGSLTVSSTGRKTFNGPADIARTSTYKVVLFAHSQQTNTTPTTNDQSTIYTTDQAGTTDDPALVMVVNRSVTAGAGSFVLTGMSAVFIKGSVLAAAAGSFILTGIAAAMGIKRYPPAGRTINFPASTLETRTLEL